MELTDLEICKRIAEIEGAVETLHSVSKPTSLTAIFKNRTSFDYSPLTDDALCFQLMVKYKVDIEHFKCGTVSAYMSDSVHGEIIEINVNKAICLAIIEAHKEQS